MSTRTHGTCENIPATDVLPFDDSASDTDILKPTIYLTGPIDYTADQEMLQAVAAELRPLLVQEFELVVVTDVNDSLESFDERLDAACTAEVVVACVDNCGADADVAVEICTAQALDIPIVYFSIDYSTELNPQCLVAAASKILDLSDDDQSQQARKIVEAIQALIGVEDSTEDTDT